MLPSLCQINSTGQGREGGRERVRAGGWVQSFHQRVFLSPLLFPSPCEGVPTPEWAIHSVIACQRSKSHIVFAGNHTWQKEQALPKVLLNIMHPSHTFTSSILLKFSATTTGCIISTEVDPVDAFGITMNYMDHPHVPLF